MPVAVIDVHHLHKRYRDHVVVQDVSFSVAQGEIFGILSPNGAGKITMAECIAGLCQPGTGNVRVLGFDPQHDRAALRQQLGVRLQKSELPEQIRVWEALDLYSSFYTNPANENHLIDNPGLTPKRNTPFRNLFGG